MAVEIKEIKVQLKAMKITFDAKADRDTLVKLYLDSCDAAIAAVGDPSKVEEALTEDQITMYNDLVTETEGGGEEDAAAGEDAEQEGADTAQDGAEMGNAATEAGQPGEGSAPAEKPAKKPTSGGKKPGKQGNTPTDQKTQRGVKVEKVATPAKVTPREVRKVYDRVSSIMDVLKDGGGTDEEIIVEANEKYIRQGGKSNPKESHFYWRIIKKTLHHVGLLIQGEDKIITIRQER